MSEDTLMGAVYNLSRFQPVNQSAAAATAVAVVVAATAVIAAVAVVAAVVVMAATAAAALHHLNLFSTGIAHIQDLALESYRTAGQRMIEVHLDVFVGNFEYLACDAKPLGGHHGQGVANLDHLGVELAVNLENILLKLYDILVGAFAESLFGSSGDVECITGLLAVDVGFERGHKAACEAIDEVFGVFFIGLVNEFFRVIGINLIKIVCEFHILAGFDFFHIIIYFDLYSINTLYLI